jgi:hypothetical protein
MENLEKTNSFIKGWGIDADPKNDPTYPMRKRSNDQNVQVKEDRPPQQVPEMELLTSIERESLPAVFGQTIPPTGISGMIRKYAFRHGEGRFRHWLPLILADRINEIEGLIDDFKNKHFPNFFKEKGRTASWKYDKKNMIKRVVLTAAAAFVIYKLIQSKKSD